MERSFQRSFASEGVGLKKFSSEASNLHLFLISQPEEKQLKKSEIIIMTPLLIFSPSLGGTDKGAWQNKKGQIMCLEKKKDLKL